MTGPNKETANYNIYTKKSNTPSLPSEVDYIKKQKVSEEDFKSNPKDLADSNKESYDYLVIGKLQPNLLLGVQNLENYDIKMNIKVAKEESSAEKIIQLIIVTIFSLIGILSCLYCIVLIITSKLNSLLPFFKN